MEMGPEIPALSLDFRLDSSQLCIENASKLKRVLTKERHSRFGLRMVLHVSPRPKLRIKQVTRLLHALGELMGVS